MKKAIVFFCLTIIAGAIRAQECTCTTLVDSLIKKTESNYAGYIHKVKMGDSTNYLRFKKKIVAAATQLSFIDCYDIMVQYVDFFKDAHLYVVEFPRANAKQSDSLLQLHPRLPANYTSPYQGKTDPITGTWQDANQQIDIVQVSKDSFYAVVKKTSIPKWETGFIKMRIRKITDTKYSILFFNDDFTATRMGSNIIVSKRLLLGFGIHKYTKLNTNDPESQYIQTDNPTKPFFKVIDKDNILLTVPSALISGHIVDSILLKHREEIQSAKNFILDLRGNTGGNFMWSGIYKLANTKLYATQKQAGEEDFLMLASMDNARYFNNFKNFFKGDSIATAYYTQLNNRIIDNVGKIIGFSYYSPGPDTAKKQILPNPQNVAVIIDRLVASAAEAVVMSLRENSKKVKVFGENSWGMIDYVNVNTIRFGCETNRRYYFGYPTFFAPEMLKNPVNPTGIKPDIYIPKSNKDWVKWVWQYLNKGVGR